MASHPTVTPFVMKTKEAEVKTAAVLKPADKMDVEAPTAPATSVAPAAEKKPTFSLDRRAHV